MQLTSLITSLCAEYYVLQHPWSVEEVCESEDANIRYEVIHYEASQQYGTETGYLVCNELTLIEGTFKIRLKKARRLSKTIGCASLVSDS
jgi:hypothetical protein